MKILFKNHVILTLLLMMIIFSSDANAVLQKADLLDTVYDNYNAAVTSWGNVIQAKAIWLFWTLALISMVWKFGILILSKGDLGEFYVEFIRFTLTLGFFLWLLTNGTAMATDIVNSMTQLAANANANTSVAMQITPSSIVDVGFNIFATITNQTDSAGIVDGLVAKLTGLVILVVIALIAVNYLVLKICAMFVIYAGVFFLGFGGSHWTSEMAISYFKTLLSISAQLFAMILLVGVGQSFVIHQQSLLSQNLSIPELSIMLVSAVILLSLTNKIPPLIGQLAMGGGAGAIGNGAGTGAAMAAAGTTAAAFSSVGSGVASGTTSGAANAIGGGQALKAAIAKAQAYEASGGIGKQTTGGLIASGIGKTVQDKVQNRVDSSFAGQVATNIKGENKDTPKFDNNSLS